MQVIVVPSEDIPDEEAAPNRLSMAQLVEMHAAPAPDVLACSALKLDASLFTPFFLPSGPNSAAHKSKICSTRRCRVLDRKFSRHPSPAIAPI